MISKFNIWAKIQDRPDAEVCGC